MKTKFFLMTFLSVMALVSPFHARAFLLDAADLIGQTDNNDPVWTTNNANNVRVPNASGFGNAKFSVIDEVYHRLFVADENRGVLVFNLDEENGLVDRVADYILGEPDLNSDIDAATQSGVSYINGLAYDKARQYLFVTDTGNNRVLVFDVASITNGEEAINVLGQLDFTSTNGSTTQNGISSAEGVMTYDSSTQRLFVSDSAARILVFDVSVITNGEDAINVLGQLDFISGNGGSGQNQFNGVTSVEIDEARQLLFVSDRGNNRILVFDVAEIVDGEDAVNVLGQPDFSTTDATGGAAGMFVPIDSSYDPLTSRLFVAEYGNSRVLVFDVAEIVDGEDAINVLGQVGFADSATATSQIGLSAPTDVTVDSVSSKLYVSDNANNRVMIFDVAEISDGEAAVDLLGQADTGGDPIWTSSAQYNSNANSQGVYRPYDSLVDEVNHRVFVNDGSNNRILIFDLDENNELEDRVADYVLGQPNFSESVFAGTTAASLNGPEGQLAYDAERQWLFVADNGNSRMLVFDVTTVTNGESAIYVLGQSDFSSNSPGAGVGLMSSPMGSDFDSVTQRLFVTDSDNNRVLVFDATEISNGEVAVNVLGQTDFDSSSSDLTRATFNTPDGLEIDEVGQRLFVSDRGNNRVLVFDVAEIVDGEDAANVLGQTDFASGAQGTSINQIGAAYAITSYDAANETLFFPDYFNNRILVFDVAEITDGEEAVGVVGMDSFDSNEGGLTRNNFNRPRSARLDRVSNRLYVADRSNSRVLVFQLPSFSTDRTLNAGRVNSAYTETLEPIGGTGPYSFSLKSGALPAGLTFDVDAGVISGTPVSAGIATFTIGLEDSSVTSPSVVGLKGSRVFTLEVVAEDAPDSGLETPNNPVSSIKFNSKKVKRDSTNRINKSTFKFKGTNPTAANGTMEIYTKTKLGGNKLVVAVHIDADGNWSKKLKKNNGTHKYAFKAINSEGTPSALSKFVTIKVDTTDPEFKTAPILKRLIKNTKFVFPGLKDKGDFEYYSVKLFGHNESWKKQTKNYYYVPNDVKPGTYTLGVKVYDQAGNKDSFTLPVRVW